MSNISRFMINWLRTGSSPRSESARENTAKLNSPSRFRRGRQSNDDPQTDMKNKYRCGISLLFSCSSSSRSKPKGCPPEKPNAYPPENPKGCPPDKPKACPPDKPKACPPDKPKEPEKPKRFWPPKELEMPKPKPFWPPENLTECSPGNPKGCSPGNPNGCSPEKTKETEKPKEPEKPKRFWQPKRFWPPKEPEKPKPKPFCSPGNPRGCSPGNPRGCSPGNPNGCSPEKPKETLGWHDWSNENRSEWHEKLEALCDLSAISDHTLYGDYGPTDDFDDIFQDHNPATFDEHRDVNDTSVGPNSIPRPPTFQDNHHVINRMMEKDYHSTGTPNSVALEYSRNQNDIVLEVESNTDYNSCGQNENIMINQHVPQNEGSDTDFEETNNTKRRTKKISISLEDLQRHFKMSMDDAAKSLDVSRSTLKRICRENNIERWPTRRKGKMINDERSSNPKKVNLNDIDQTNDSTMSRALIFSRPLTREASSSSNNVTIKATYGDDIAKFPFAVSSGLNDLKEKVCQRLEINIPIKLKCMDDDGDLIVISCDDALHELFGKRLARSGDHSNTTFDFKVFQITN